MLRSQTSVLSSDDARLLVRIAELSGGDADLAAWAVEAASKKGGLTLASVLEEITPNRLRSTSPAETLGNSLEAEDVITDIQSAAGPSRLLDLRLHGVAFPGEVVEREGALMILGLRERNGGNVYIPFEDTHTRVPHYTASLDAGIPGTSITGLEKWGGVITATAELRRGKRIFVAHGTGLTEALARRAAELATLLSARMAS